MNEGFNKSLMKFTLRVSAGILKLRFTFHKNTLFFFAQNHAACSLFFPTNVPFFFRENIFLYFRFVEEELQLTRFPLYESKREPLSAAFSKF